MRLVASALGALALAGCGRGPDEAVTVFAAASLTEAFRALHPAVRFNFAGSDELATQIREGARADVYAAASPRYAADLHEEGLVEAPRTFATNRLVVVVPADNPAGIGSVDELATPGTQVLIGGRGVPVGDYARAALASAGLEAVLRNVVSNEEDVRGVLAKVAAGDADAGFVYATDAKAAAGRVRVVELPAAAQVEIRYPIAVVADARDAEAARAFVALVLGERGRRALARAGFGLP